jgi:tetratricopeptide (TPR) repeat protein
VRRILRYPVSSFRGAAMDGKIFINYRRDDSIGTAGRLHDRLVQAFGRDKLFMDVDHIPAGEDFVGYLNAQVASCDVFLALIGPDWLNAMDESGRRRLDNPDDFVTIEIAAALARNTRVIPVMIEGARMPKAEEVPDSIKALVRRHAVEVRHSQFGRDAEALVAKVREALGGESARLNRRRAGVAAGTLAAAVALFLAGWFGLERAGLVAWTPWTLQRDADNAKAAAEAEAKRKSDEAAQQQLAAARAEEERKAKEAAEADAKRKSDEAEQQRLAAVSAEDERRAKAAAEAEAKRKSDEAEQQRLAALKVQDERKAREAAEARARYSVLVSQGNVDSYNGAYDRAIATFNEAIRIDATSAVAFNNRGAAYAKKGDNDRAIADYTEAVRLDPRSAFAFYNRGLAYAKKGDGNRAIADYTEAIRLDPRSASTFYDRGLAYQKRGDNDRAIADYTEAIRLDPKNASALNNRGFLYETKGDNDRAIADYSAAIRLDPDAARYFCNRGRAKLKNKDASGRADVAKARQLDASTCR